METTEIKESLKAIFTDTLGHNSFELEDDTTAKDVDGWDSVTHMMLINEIEKKYNIKFSLMDLMNLENIGSLIKAIKNKVGSSLIYVALCELLELESLILLV